MPARQDRGWGWKAGFELCPSQLRSIQLLHICDSLQHLFTQLMLLMDPLPGLSRAVCWVEDSGPEHLFCFMWHSDVRMENKGTGIVGSTYFNFEVQDIDLRALWVLHTPSTTETQQHWDPAPTTETMVASAQDFQTNTTKVSGVGSTTLFCVSAENHNFLWISCVFQDLWMRNNSLQKVRM